MVTDTKSFEKYVVVSTDTHAGADLLDYKPYLEKRWHDDFDAWATDYVDPWGRFLPKGSEEVVAEPGEHPNWDSDVRINVLEGEGVAAEILYPNTIPPFFPSLGLFIPLPKTQDEYDHRWAGLQAHNRWQSDFCSQTPGRRVGLAQILLNDLDDALAEVRWAKENEFGGILIPAVPPNHPSVPGIWNKRFEPLWSLCEELEMAVNQHAGSGAPDIDVEDHASRAIMLTEIQFFSHRTLGHLILGGVLERHPKLKFVFTEEGAAWVDPVIKGLDQVVQAFSVEGTTSAAFVYDAVKDFSLLPSEYFARQCYVATFLTRPEVAMRNELGVNNMMWATDYPHQESTVPNSLAAMRVQFAGVPESDCRRILGLNAVDVYGLDLDLLSQVAQRIGPTVEIVNTPIVRAPENPRTCPVFVGGVGVMGS